MADLILPPSVAPKQEPLEALRSVLASKAGKYNTVFFNANGEWLFRAKGEFNTAVSVDEVMESSAKNIEDLLSGKPVSKPSKSKK